MGNRTQEDTEILFIEALPMHTNSFRNPSCRDHFFDAPERAVRKPRRKKQSTLARPEEPARGAVTLRSLRYKINNEKVKAADRAGLTTQIRGKFQS